MDSNNIILTESTLLCWRKIQLLSQVSENHRASLYDHYTVHDDVIKWKHFPRYWPFVRGIHRSPVNSPHKGKWRGALVFFFVLFPKKRLSKQSWGWWFETPSGSLWRHSNVPLLVTMRIHNIITWRQNNVIITTSRRHFDVIIML